MRARRGLESTPLPRPWTQASPLLATQHPSRPLGPRCSSRVPLGWLLGPWLSPCALLRPPPLPGLQGAPPRPRSTTHPALAGPAPELGSSPRPPEAARPDQRHLHQHVPSQLVPVPTSCLLSPHLQLTRKQLMSRGPQVYLKLACVSPSPPPSREGRQVYKTVLKIKFHHISLLKITQTPSHEPGGGSDPARPSQSWPTAMSRSPPGPTRLPSLDALLQALYLSAQFPA